MLRNGFASFILFGFVCAMLGCGGTRQVAVEGDVSFDGQPIEEGSISFIPEAGTASRKASAAIIKGNYRVLAENGPSPGKFKVEISWMKKTGKKLPSADPGMTADETKEVIPAKYNTASTLVRDIGAGDNRLDFKLEGR